MSETPQLQASGGLAGVIKGRYALAVIALMAMAVCACLMWLGKGPMLSDHEAINAQGARQTLESGEWLIPQVSEVTRVRKTPLGIWSIATATWLTNAGGERPVSEWSARLPAAIAGVLNALIVWWLGMMLFGRRIGLVAGFVTAGCVATIYYGRNAQVDMVLTMLTALCYACFWRGAMHERPSRWFMALFYVALATAMMAKAPLPLVTVGFTLAVYWFVTKPLLAASENARVNAIQAALADAWQQARGLGRLWLIPGMVLFLLLAGAWPYYIYKHVPNVLALWDIEYLSRYSGGLSSRSQPFYYYIPMAFGLTVPFMLSLPEALVAVFLKRYREQRAGLAFALTWALVGTVFLSTASYKRPHYLLSIMPAYCLLLAPVIERLFFGAVAAKRWLIWLTCAAVPVGLGVGFMFGANVIHSDFPGLQRTYVVAAATLWGLWTLAAASYAIGRRTASFGLLCAWVLVITLVVWPGLGRQMQGDPPLNALVQELENRGIPKNAPIYWVEGRVNSTIEFYSGYQVQRLIDELEMVELRPDRSEVSAELMRAIAKRMEMQLERPEPVYLILKIGSYELLKRETDIKARVLFEQTGFKEFPGDEWAVITQPIRETRPE